MPEVVYSKSVPASRERIWEYVKDMDNWAPFIMGYQSHEQKDDRHSIWTVKGEMGVLARTVVFDVKITEWLPLQRVSFSLEGVTEKCDGGGSFLIGAKEQPIGAVSRSRRGGRFRALLRRWFRRSGREEASAETLVDSADETAFSFTLSLHAGGMTGPVVNAMIEPLMGKAADDLAEKLTAEILRSDGDAGERTAP